MQENKVEDEDHNNDSPRPNKDDEPEQNNDDEDSKERLDEEENVEDAGSETNDE